MTILQALFLGALQGLAEFLPVSSSGHLVLARTIMEIGELPLLFDVLLHISTLLVIILVFREKIIRILVGLWRIIIRKPQEEDMAQLRLTLVILLATIFTAGLGFAIKDLEITGNPKVVSALLILTGGILLAARTARGTKTLNEITWVQGTVTGIAQGFGVLPGISRSGITIAASLFSGLDRKSAGDFAFLISIPAVLGAFILTLKDATELTGSVGVLPIVVGMVSSFAVGLASLLFLLRLIRNGKLHLFAFYLIPAGIAGLIFL